MRQLTTYGQDVILTALRNEVRNGVTPDALFDPADPSYPMFHDAVTTDDEPPSAGRHRRRDAGTPAADVPTTSDNGTGE